MSAASRDGLDILITYPHSMGAGGGGTIGCIQIAKHLRAQGARVTIASVTTMSRDRRLFRNPPLPEERVGAQQEEELRAAGVEVVRIAPHPVHYYLDGIPTRRTVKRLLAQRRYDVALGWHQEFAHLPRWLQRRGIVAGLFTSGWYRDFKDIRKVTPNRKLRAHLWVQGKLLRMSLDKVDVVIAISEFTKREVHGSFGVPLERFQVAPWGVDPIFAAAERKPERAIRRFVFFGSPDPRKGGLETIDAFGEVAKAGVTDWHLTVIWPHRQKLEQKVREHSLEGKVTILDPMSHAGLARALAEAQVAILPSKFESFGLACAEAQMSGIPVIAYDVGGVSEVVHDGATGWLVENERTDLLPAAIAAAMANPERTFAMGLAGREHIQRNYSWEKTAATIRGRLERLVRERRG